jgi:hypothetical protein
MLKRHFSCLLVVSAVLLSAAVASADAIIADHTICGPFGSIPESVIDEIQAHYRIFYGHTSHGSQIVTGMSMLYDEDDLFAYNAGDTTIYLTEYGDDLGHNGDVSWVPITRARLDNPSYDLNTVMWSWCGGCSDNTEEGINIYLNAMSDLELDYPNVLFIYMTGHLDGTGPSGNLYARNNQIRAYCEANNKVLFDFADVESWDPDGNYYPDEHDYCAWCSDWCAEHYCPDCSSCAHSHCFNCYQKGKAFWWLMGAYLMGMSSDVQEGTVVPGALLEQNRPNPFNPVTAISFVLDGRSHVALDIYNMAGRHVRTLVDSDVSAGEQTIRWDGRDDDGCEMPSGCYFYSLATDDTVETRKMVLLR